MGVTGRNCSNLHENMVTGSPLSGPYQMIDNEMLTRYILSFQFALVNEPELYDL